ncbi:COG1835 Predicted acyltransferases [Candidatus Nanopelagicaceae bacterium]
MSSKARIHQIQALRALAASLVVFFHANLSPGGFIGVDIFYVISGYLITGLIIKEIELTSAFGFKSFYLRRAKRLLPASLGILSLTAVISWLVLPATVRTDLGKDIVAATIYVSNYLFAFWQNDYQNLNATPSPVIHYWSLAVEEQFYIFWPIAIYTLWKFGKRSAVLAGVSAITILSFFFSLYLTERSPIWAFYSLPTRAWELGLGALILFIPKRILQTRSIAKTLAIWFALSLLVFASFTFSEKTPFPGTSALIPTLAATIAIAFIASWPPILNDLSKLRIVQWLGEISYPFYLWHWPILVLPSTRFGRPLTLIERALLIALTALAADLTHRFIEKPIARTNPSQKKILQLSIFGTAGCALLAGAILLSSSNIISLSNGRSVSIAAVMEKPKVYLDDCHVNNGETLSGECTYGDKGSQRTIVLYGDSHAAQWFPALEMISKDNGLKLVSLTKSACPAPEVKKVEIGAYKNADCFAWRKNAIKRIAEINPDAVLLSGFQHFDFPKNYSSREVWWAQGQQIAFNHLNGLAKRLIYITDTPHPIRDIPNCLASGAGEKCDGSEKSAAKVTGAFTVLNPTSWLCGNNCPAIVDGVVAYRDASHISVAMSEALAPKLEDFLIAQGVL